ncbi:heme-binding protein [Phaeovulum sp.]|uniref:GlcG/HbpS family heme-binding protein n=1 Tax=Phaeovulum sp. TaxID=2934796 RepID=UPI003569922D
MSLNLEAARRIISVALAHGADHAMKPLSVVVVDAGGHPIAFERSDGASPGRFEIARAKAYGAVMLGLGGFALAARAESQPSFVSALNGAFDGRIMPVAGGVLVRDATGQVIGAVGITGDTSDNDAAAALVGIKAVGLTGEA